MSCTFFYCCAEFKVENHSVSNFKRESNFKVCSTKQLLNMFKLCRESDMSAAATRNIYTKHARIKNHVTCTFFCSGILLLITFEESTVLITDMHFLEFSNGRIRQVSRTEENGVIICIPRVCTGYFRIAKTLTFSLNVNNHTFFA